jgi:hypothetical protein
MKGSTHAHNDPLGRALKKHYLNNFDIDDCVKLLLDAREEKFSYERCIRLFQFQTWIWYPSKRGIAPRAAGRLAAAAILREIEEDRFGKNITLGKLQNPFAIGRISTNIRRFHRARRRLVLVADDRG